MSNAGPGGVQSLHRSLDLVAALESAGAHGGHLPLAELAGAAGIPAATAHRLLRTLVERGYVRQRPDRRYALGFRLVPLGTTAAALLGEVAEGVLADLVGELGETADLAVLAGRRAEYVAQAPGRYSMRMSTQVGHRVALHCTGVGKALLAQLDEAAVAALATREGLPGHTEHTLTTLPALRAALAQVREQGYAEDHEEQEPGVRSVAVPVGGAGVGMAVSISGPLTRVTDEVVGRAVPALQAAAVRLEQGHRDP